MADQTYVVTLEVPHPVRSWKWVSAGFDERLAAEVTAPVLAADLVTEVRRGRDELRLRIAVTVRAGDVGQAVTAAWDDLEDGEFDLGAATLEAGPRSVNAQPSQGLGRWSPGTASTPARASVAWRPVSEFDAAAFLKGESPGSAEQHLALFRHHALGY